MIDELLPYAPPSILIPELEQVIRDIDFIDQKADEFYMEEDKTKYEKACLRKGMLMAYRDKLLGHLKERLGVK